MRVKALLKLTNLLLAMGRPGKMGGATHFTLQCGRRLRDGSYQEPVVALVCSFGLSSGGLMSPDQAKTLFHEFGHALHSLLSRTEFQHLAGELDQLILHSTCCMPYWPQHALPIEMTASLQRLAYQTRRHQVRDQPCDCGDVVCYDVWS